MLQVEMIVQLVTSSRSVSDAAVAQALAGEGAQPPDPILGAASITKLRMRFQ
jgi:hypothetical protein